MVPLCHWATFVWAVWNSTFNSLIPFYRIHEYKQIWMFCTLVKKNIYFSVPIFYVLWYNSQLDYSNFYFYTLLMLPCLGNLWSSNLSYNVLWGSETEFMGGICTTCWYAAFHLYNKVYIEVAFGHWTLNTISRETWVQASLVFTLY